MTNKNPYRKKAHISAKKTREIIKYFALDITASRASILCNLNPNTVENWYRYFRDIIYKHSIDHEKEIWKWTIEMDESYFWPRRVKWKRWRWASSKVKVFWLLKRKWKVFTRIVPDCSANSLIPIIRWKISLENSIINTDYWKPYDGLVDLWAKKHYRVKHSKNEFARWEQHINWIESFWSYCKRRLIKFNWVRHSYFHIYLKECEFRFNAWLSNENIYKKLMKLCRIYSLN